MANVLPADVKKNLDRRTRARTVFVIALMLACAAAVAMLSLVPALISISTARAALNAPSLDEANGARDDQAKARRAQMLLDALQPLSLASSTPSLALADALDLVPAGVSISTITFQASNDQLVLTGVSSARESISEYRDALEASGLFSKVDIPVAALVGTQEGRFTVTLTRKP